MSTGMTLPMSFGPLAPGLCDDTSRAASTISSRETAAGDTAEDGELGFFFVDEVAAVRLPELLDALAALLRLLGEHGQRVVVGQLVASGDLARCAAPPARGAAYRGALLVALTHRVAEVVRRAVP